MAVEDIYKTGVGEATILPRTGLPELKQQEFLYGEKRKQEEQSANATALKDLYAIEGNSWDIVNKEFRDELNALKDKTAARLGPGGDLKREDLPRVISREFMPLLEKGKSSLAQEKLYNEAYQKYALSPKNTYDESAEANLFSYYNPKTAAATNPTVKAQLESVGWDDTAFRRVYGNEYLKLPLRYDDVEFTQNVSSKIESVPSLRRASSVDPYTGNRVVQTWEGVVPNKEAIIGVINSLETQAASGDETGQNFWRYRLDNVAKNVALKDDNGIMVIDPSNSTERGREIVKIAKQNFSKEFSNPQTLQAALAKADAYMNFEGYQKRQSNYTEQHVAKNDAKRTMYESDLFPGGWESAIQKLGGTTTEQIITPATGDRTGGSTTFYRRSMDNVKTALPLGPQVFNATLGKMEDGGQVVEATLSGRGMEYVYKKGTKRNGKDVGGSIIPQYDHVNSWGDMQPKYMVQAKVIKNVDGEKVEETVYLPYEQVKNSYIDQVQGGVANREEEMTYDVAMLYALDAREQFIKEKAKEKKTGAEQQKGQSPSSQYDKYKR